MEQKELISLLQKPSAITGSQTAALKELLEEYPYFQTARAIQLKGLKNQGSLHYNKQLKVTAAHTTDRSVLFDFITSEEFNQNQISDRIKEHIKTETEEIPDQPTKEEKEPSLDEALKMKLKESEQIFDPELFSRAEKKGEEKTKANTTGNSEKDLQLGKPLSFQKNESHSFSEWLQLTKAQPLDRTQENQNQPDNQTRKFDLIDEFILKSPKIKPTKSSIKPNLAEQQQIAPEALMTETLARVYLEQKNYKKAIQAYKILILKNPEKSGFFADQIRAIEKLQEYNS